MTAIPRAIWLPWLALMGLLAATFALAYVPLGRAALPVALAIGVVKAVIVLLIFMELIKARGILPIFACVGFFFLSVLFVFAFADYLTRSHEVITQGIIDRVPVPAIPRP